MDVNVAKAALMRCETGDKAWAMGMLRLFKHTAKINPTATQRAYVCQTHPIRPV
jgi:hypothetical protein